MKLRKYIFIVATILSFIILVFGLTFLEREYHSAVSIVSAFLFGFTLINFLFGFSRFIIYFIYGIITVSIIYLIPNDYRLLAVFLLTVIIVVNPLVFFEVFLDNKLTKKATKIYELKIKGKYETFYKYRKAMKEYYHFPQTQKLFTKKWYNLTRNGFVIAIFSMLIFLIVYTTSIVLSVSNLSDVNVLFVYFQVVLTFMLLALYKRGFTSMFRVARITVLPSIYYLIYVSNLTGILAILFYAILTIAIIGVFIAEVYFYYTRVKYQAYEYTNPNNNEKVFANALYEPFIYDDNKISVLYEFEASLDLFHKKRFELIVYANSKRTIITAYEAVNRKIKVYVEMYDKKMIELYQVKLAAMFKTSIKWQLLDENYYESMFLHNHEYIITRALSLAYMLNELEIKDELIIKTSIFFDSIEKAKELIFKYETELQEVDGKLVLDVVLKVKNVEYLIESKLRDLLLDMLIYGGVFIRIKVYY